MLKSQNREKEIQFIAVSSEKGTLQQIKSNTRSEHMSHVQMTMNAIPYGHQMNTTNLTRFSHSNRVSLPVQFQLVTNTDCNPFTKCQTKGQRFQNRA